MIFLRMLLMLLISSFVNNGNLAACTAICALGMYINAYTILSGGFVQFAFLIGMAFVMSKISNVYEDEKTRLGYL